ncbi:serine protease SP24D-like [Hermetia illucens]|nr:serine protease SP24D-like [Hermetia illucens]
MQNRRSLSILVFTMAKLAIAALFGLFFVPALAYDPRIVGGKTASAGQFPYQVALKRSGSFLCGGSIISSTFILTAAHCVVDGNNNAYAASLFTVVAGTTNYNSGGVSKTGKKVYVHESYGNFKNDIALIELSSALTFSSTIQPIALATSAPPTGASILISGWGRLSTSGSLPSQLQYNTLSAATTSACASSGVNYAGLLCLAHSSGHGACNGDSGGPAAYNGKIVGVANFVVGGCGSSYPDGYALVPYFYNWIVARVN